MYGKALAFLAAAAVAVATPTIVLAHPGVGQAHDLMHGFVHPFTGLDHVIAMLAVGVFAAQLGGRTLWLVPGDLHRSDGGGGHRRNGGRHYPIC